MWIKHGNALYNSTGIDKIYISSTTIKAKFKDGTVEVIGRFNTVEETEGILRSVTQAILFENQEHPGVIIRDTRKPSTSRKKQVIE